MAKIVIDIPDDEYNAICNNTFDTDGYFKMNLSNAFRNGTSLSKEKTDMLDKIWAEVQQKCCITVSRENDPAIILYDALQIIDKYRKESEDIKILPSVAPKEKTEWIPVKFRELTEEEKEELATEYGEELDKAFDCRLPDDGQEVLVSTKWGVEKDTFYINGYGMYFENYDADEVKAWMPLPKPYKAESEGYE